MFKYLKNNIVVIIAILIFLVLGTFCLMISGKDFIKVFSYIVSISLSIIGIILFVLAFKIKANLTIIENQSKINSPIGYIIQGLILISLSVLIILFPESMVRVAFGITFILIPIIKLFFADNKKNYLMKNFWKFIIGIIFIFAINIIMDIIFIILGILFYLLIAFLIYLLIKNYYQDSRTNIVSKYFIAYIIKKSAKE